MRIITIINQKGGCGKTTTAINLSSCLARRGLRTLLVDMDPQSHCAAGLGIPEHRIDLDIGDAMLAPSTKPIDATRLLWRAGRNLDLAPSRMKLAGLEAVRGGLAERPDRERRLAQVLERFKNDYDFVIVDSSPAIGLLTFNALAAASAVIVPVETSFFSLQGATKQVSTIKTLNKRLGITMPIWLLPTIHDETSAVAADLLEELRRRFPSNVIPTVIRRDTKLRESASFGQPVFEHAPDSQGARDYTGLCDWAMTTLKGKTPVREEAAPSTLDSNLDIPLLEEVQAELAGSEPLAHIASSTGQTVEPAGDSSDVASALRSALLGSMTASPAAETPVLSRAAELVQRAQKLLRRDTDAPAPETATPRPGAPIAVHLEAVEMKPARQVDESLFGVRATAQGILFVQPISCGTSVAIAGDFNRWSAEAGRMKRNDELGVYQICIPVPPGRHQYRLVVDGRWTADPYNPNQTTNPFGELNSVISVLADTPALQPA